MPRVSRAATIRRRAIRSTRTGSPCPRRAARRRLRPPYVAADRATTRRRQPDAAQKTAPRSRALLAPAAALRPTRRRNATPRTVATRRAMPKSTSGAIARCCSVLQRVASHRPSPSAPARRRRCRRRARTRSPVARSNDAAIVVDPNESIGDELHRVLLVDASRRRCKNAPARDRSGRSRGARSRTRQIFRIE